MGPTHKLLSSVRVSAMRTKLSVRRIGARNMLLLALALHVIGFCILRPIWSKRAHEIDNQGSEDFDKNVYGENPPVIKARVNSMVQEFQWNSVNEESVCRVLRPFAESRSNAEPVIIRGAVNWDAMNLWNLTWLASQDIEVDMWMAPGMKFFYIQEEVLHEKMARRDSNIPVAHLITSAKEAVGRMQANSMYSPGYFRDKECYYVRFDPTPSMNQNFDLHSGALSCILKHIPFHYLKKKLRLWVSPKGAISPLHFDGGTSCLIQLRGQKRMVLYQNEDLDSVYPYPDDHLLRRRGQVDPLNPDYIRFPKYKDVIGKLAILNPGDALFFSPQSPHYTDTLSTSISMTMRW